MNRLTTAFGIVILGAAGLARAQGLTLADTPLFTVPAGTAPLGGAGTNLERGIAYNPQTGNLLVASRATPPTVFVLNGQTGAVLGSLNMSGISGGDPVAFPINMLDIDSDGRIYVANLTVNSGTTNFKVYRWDSESDALTTGGNETAATVYNGNPAGAGITGVRYGDSFDVIGSGDNVQLLAGARAAARVAVFTPDPGTGGFAATNITTDYAVGNVGLAWQNGNTFWSKLGSNPLRQVSIDGGTLTGTTVASNTIADASTAPLGVDAANNLLGLINYSVTAPNPSLILYDISNPAAVVEVTRRTFPSANANANAVGDVEFGNGVVYALNTNNGLIAYAIVPEPGALALMSLGGLFLFRRLRY